MRKALGVVTMVILAGCPGGGGGPGGPPPPAPVLTNMNGSTTPSSPVNVAIELVGTNFGTATGTVRFVQGAATVNVTPSGSGAWANTSILVTVPGTLAAPGSATVTVLTAGGGTSNSLQLNLVVAPSFSPSNQTWALAPALPNALRGHQAVAVPGSSSTGAWVYVVGGNTGSATVNVANVLMAGVSNAGAVTAWSQASALPVTRSFAAVAEADPSNSPVAAGTAYVYVIGGQANANDAPGGTNTVYVGTVTQSTGAISWAANATTLPETRLGAKAVVFNGFLYVTGGLSATGTPLTLAASAPINTNGTVGTFTEAGNAYIAGGLAFHETFAFGGFLYAIGGDSATSTTPYANTLPAATTTQFASIRDGVVGTWTATAGSPNKQRSKFAIVFSFGQLVIYEGLYTGAAGSSEGEVSSVAATGNLNSFNGLTGSNAPGLNTYNTAAVSTPLITTGTPTKPVWLLIAGDTPGTPGTPVATVKVGP